VKQRSIIPILRARTHRNLRQRLCPACAAQFCKRASVDPVCQPFVASAHALAQPSTNQASFSISADYIKSSATQPRQRRAPLQPLPATTETSRAAPFPSRDLEPNATAQRSHNPLEPPVVATPAPSLPNPSNNKSAQQRPALVKEFAPAPLRIRSLTRVPVVPRTSQNKLPARPDIPATPQWLWASGNGYYVL
jgi:hypothetical protein